MTWRNLAQHLGSNRSSSWFVMRRFCASSIKVVTTLNTQLVLTTPCHVESAGVRIARAFHMRFFLVPVITLMIVSVIPIDAASAASQDDDRRALAAALESLIATGQPGHTTHDQGQWLQIAVDAAIARGDREIEQLAIRAAAPLTASITRPVSSAEYPPGIKFGAENALRVPRPVPYTARIAASVDNGQFVDVTTVQSGKSAGGGVSMLPAPASQPGFHVVRLRAEFRFGTTAPSGAEGWTEVRNLGPVSYAIYDSNTESSAAVRALVYGPASTHVSEFDPLLGDEPFGVWLSDVLSARSKKNESGPDWLSQYCDERTGEAGLKVTSTGVCSVIYFGLGRDIGQIWFRTADIRETDQGIEWIPLSPAQFEGLLIRDSAQQTRLSRLPSLLDTTPTARPVGDVSIMPDDIVVSPAEPIPGAFAAATVTVRNIGDGDLYKVQVGLVFGVDPSARGTMRQFVVDIPAQQSVDLRLQVAFPNGYGFVMAHALQLTEHSPHDNGMPDPTPMNACAFRIVNRRLASAQYVDSLLHDAGGCNGK